MQTQPVQTSAEQTPSEPESTVPPDPAAQPADPDAGAIELQPYRVSICLSVNREAGYSPAEQEQLAAQLQQASNRTRGQTWRSTVVLRSPVWPENAAGLERLSTKGPDVWTFPAEAEHAAVPGPSPIDSDKLFLLTLSGTGTELQLAGREWDSLLERLGPVVTRTVDSRRSVVQQALLLLNQLFTPRLRIDSAAGETVQLTLCSGALPAGDVDLQTAGPGSLLVPSYRYLDREGAVRRIDRMPWTWLVVESARQEEITCRMVSGLRAALGTGHRRRVEAWAGGVHVNFPATDLQLLRQGTTPRPLIAHDVTVAHKRFPTEEAERPLARHLTDRNGTFPLAAVPESPIVWLYMHSGSTILARLPFVPGVEPQVTVPLPDDSLRLQVEGELQLLQNELIDTVARRAGILARLLRLGGNGQWETVDRLLLQLDQLPAVSDFESRLTAISVPPLNSAIHTGDRATVARIRRMVKRQQELILRYLDPDRVRAVREELIELRQLDRQDGTGQQ